MFGLYLISLSRNPSLQNELFYILILGFALSEATALFALIMAFLILFDLISNPKITDKDISEN